MMDIIIVFLIISMINYIIPTSENTLNIQANMNELNEQMLREEINFSTYFNEYSVLTHSLDRSNILYYFIIIIVIHIYFIVVPIFTQGKTLCMYFLNLKVVEKNKEKTSIKALWIRNFIINGLFYFIFLILFNFIFSNKIYFISIIILGFIQLLLVIISAFMVIYRKDCRGLQDIFSNSKILEEVKQ